MPQDRDRETQNSRLDNVTDKIVELTVILDRTEEVISKLEDISSRLTLSVGIHTEKIGSIERHLHVVEQEIKRITSDASNLRERTLSTDMLSDHVISKIDNKEKYVTQDSFYPIKKAVYTIIGIILTGFFTALVAMVYKGSGH